MNVGRSKYKVGIDWFPTISISFEELIINLPKGVSIYEKNNDEWVVLFDGESYINVFKTEIGGTKFMQSGKNQLHGEMIEKLENHFKIKFVSYIGFNWKDEYIGLDKYKEAVKREYPK